MPDGHLRSRRWRVVAATAVAGRSPPWWVAPWPRALQETVVPIPNPMGLAGVAGAVAGAVSGIGLLLWIGSVLAALVSLVLRFRSSRGTERQQLRWVAAGATATVVGLLVGDRRLDGSTYCAVLLPAGRGWRWRCCATASGTWTAWSAGPSPTLWSPPCWWSPTC